MAEMPPVVVQPMPRVQTPFGLFSQLTFRPGMERWQGAGIELDLTDRCDPATGVVEFGCATGEGAPDVAWPDPAAYGNPEGDEPNEDADDGWTFPAFTVVARSKCSPLVSRADVADRALVNLTAQEQFLVEEKFWELALTRTFSAGDSLTPSVALSRAESEYVVATRGALPVLHMGRQLASALKGQIEVKGQQAQTKLGTPVVIGGGYDDDAILATSPLVGYRSEVYQPVDQNHLLVTSSNDQHGLAMRDYVLGFELCHARQYGVTLPTA